MEVISNLCVKWSGKEYTIDLTESTSVGELKSAIQKQTGVLPERQKLLNLKFKGKPPSDDCKVCQLKLKSGFKVMMMGSLEEDIIEVAKAPEDVPEVINDLDIEDDVEVPFEQKDIYLAKVQRRIKDYKIEILNEPRPGKKLLVLDIDYTLFDHRSSAETCAELMRPYLHEFLHAAYEQYDIVIWSATNMKWIKEKMRLLGVSSSDNYKIAFYLDHLAMISVEIPNRGVVDVKPLGVIWGKFEGLYTPQNTIMFDDIRRNFLMNPKNGLRIKPFRKAHMNRDKDCELLYLGQYLKDLATCCDDFTSVDHRHWEDYDPKKTT